MRHLRAISDQSLKLTLLEIILASLFLKWKHLKEQKVDLRDSRKQRDAFVANSSTINTILSLLKECITEINPSGSLELRMSELRTRLKEGEWRLRVLESVSLSVGNTVCELI